MFRWSRWAGVLRGVHHPAELHPWQCGVPIHAGQPAEQLHHGEFQTSGDGLPAAVSHGIRESTTVSGLLAATVLFKKFAISSSIH